MRAALGATARPGLISPPLTDKSNLAYPSAFDNDASDISSRSQKLRQVLDYLTIGGKYPVQQQIENKRRGIPKQSYPILCWVLTVGTPLGLARSEWRLIAMVAAMCGVMIWEMVSNQKAQGSPISTKPVFNYMVGGDGIDFRYRDSHTHVIWQIGPSSEVLINDGARFVPCMKLVDELVSQVTDGDESWADSRLDGALVALISACLPQ